MRDPDPIDDAYRAELEAAKRASVGQLLMRAARLFNERATARVRERRGHALRPVHTALFPHLALEGTRASELARKMGISKQAVGQVVGELEAAGLVRRVPDPSDGRARLVRFTARGRRALLDGIGLMGEIEGELAASIGDAPLARLARDLATLVAALEAEARER